MDDENINKIKEAMIQLGVSGKVTPKPIGMDLYVIKIDGEYFGIYDMQRETFVD